MRPGGRPQAAHSVPGKNTDKQHMQAHISKAVRPPQTNSPVSIGNQRSHQACFTALKLVPLLRQAAGQLPCTVSM
jgi:hypothetical protein